MMLRPWGGLRKFRFRKKREVTAGQGREKHGTEMGRVGEGLALEAQDRRQLARGAGGTRMRGALFYYLLAGKCTQTFGLADCDGVARITRLSTVVATLLGGNTLPSLLPSSWYLSTRGALGYQDTVPRNMRIISPPSPPV